jgi:hypothetical protein
MLYISVEGRHYVFAHAMCLTKPKTTCGMIYALKLCFDDVGGSLCGFWLVQYLAEMMEVRNVCSPRVDVSLTDESPAALHDRGQYQPAFR